MMSCWTELRYKKKTTKKIQKLTEKTQKAWLWEGLWLLYTLSLSVNYIKKYQMKWL